jgi:hypothetical protein
MTLDLTTDEARLLAVHLERHVRHLDTELVRTDKHELQHEIAQEQRALEAILARLQAATEA